MSPQEDVKKTVLITGCSPGGIGHSLALEFHSRNYSVFATARSTKMIKDLSDLGIETLALELKDSESISSLHSRIQRSVGVRGLDILVNNAGRNCIMPALDLDIDDARETFEVNTLSVMRMCQTFAPMLIRAKGKIVMIGSLAGLTPYIFGAAYNASKAALHAYTDTLRLVSESACTLRGVGNGRLTRT